MPDSSHRNEKGTPSPLPVPPAIPPEAESDSVWDDNAFSIPASALTEAVEVPADLTPHQNPAGDDQPTVISRPPNLNGTGEHHVNSLRGRRLAHFELIAPIGIGGMAAVIKGRDLELDRIVALKVLPPEMAADPENIRRFHQEARAAAKLDHENIARVFYYGEDQNLHFIAFEFVQGDNLRIILERRGRLPVGEALHYILQVTTGLAHAASRGVVHRDIKPSNIIITPTGRAKLVDMGLARTQIPQDERQLTQSGVTLGTFDYISPEQAMEPRSADVRSDIYSLGCTFYHMLTGQPPVPEGTAAKKLHFHEHELPVDPRQLNPDVPDEVAAILSRMMAKNPRDRYQKPEQLVEELLRVAQKVEAGGERADGLLYVDAPVPARPRGPVILVALAIAAVIALVFAVQQTGQPRNNMPIWPSARGQDPVSKGQEDIKPPVKPSDTGKTEQPRAVQPVQVSAPQSFIWDKDSRPEQLAKFALGTRTAQADVEVILKEDLDLSGNGEEAGGVALTLFGKSIKIRSADGERRTIFLRYTTEGKSKTTALSLQADRVELSGLRIKIQGAASVGMTGVKIVGGVAHEVKDCYFYQRFPSYAAERPLTSLALADDPRAGQGATLRITGCVFLGEEGKPPLDKEMLFLGRGGQYAVARQGTGVIVASQCVFGPHQACIRLDGEGSPRSGDDDVKVLHSSALLSDGSTVFSLSEEASANINVRYSLFSRPQPRIEEGGAAILIRQGSKNNSRGSWVTYQGQGNRYHGVDGYWVDGPREQLASATWKDFQDRSSGGDIRSIVVDRFPWNDPEPLESLRRFNVGEAFRAKLLMPEMRLKDGPDEVLVGVQKWDRYDYINAKLPPADPDPSPRTTRKEKIVDPTFTGTAGNGIFRTLKQALADTQPGDVVWIKHNGKLPLNSLTLEKDPLAIDKAGLNVTIKPMAGFHPILNLATTKPDAALIQLHEGRIEFQDLDFLLEPSQKDFKSQALLAVAGEGICTFKGCTITMNEPQGCQLAVVVLDDPAGLMRRPVRPGEVTPVGPALRFDHCLVRGKGDLISCRVSQPFKLELVQTALALGGSLLTVEGSKYAADLPAPGPTDTGSRCTIDLQNVTALASGPLFQLRSTMDLKSLVPIKCNVTNSLLAPLGSKSLVVLAGLDAKVSDAAFKERLAWEGNKNVYGNFLGMVDQQPGSVEMMKPRPFDRDKWKELASETDSKFLEQIKFTEPITSAMLPGLRRSQLAVAGLEAVGANLENLPDRLRE